VSVSSSLSNGNQIMTLTPVGLVQNTSYTLIISGVSDLAGNLMTSAVTSVFVTGAGPDFSVPSVVSVSPANQASGVAAGTKIQVKFSKFMNVLTINAATFTLTSAGSSAVPGAISTSADGTTVTFTPNAPLASSKTY